MTKPRSVPYKALFPAVFRFRRKGGFPVLVGYKRNGELLPELPYPTQLKRWAGRASEEEWKFYVSRINCD